MRICERDGLLNISCPSGNLITVLSAFYGRRSRNVCPRENHQRFCEAENADANIRELCEGYPACSIPSVNSFFGDPCIGTTKYVEVTYKCTPNCGKNVVDRKIKKTVLMACIYISGIVTRDEDTITVKLKKWQSGTSTEHYVEWYSCASCLSRLNKS